MYVASDARAVVQLLVRAAEELQRHRLLDLVVTVDGGADGLDDLAEDVR